MKIPIAHVCRDVKEHAPFKYCLAGRAEMMIFDKAVILLSITVHLKFVDLMLYEKLISLSVELEIDYPKQTDSPIFHFWYTDNIYTKANKLIDDAFI